MTCRPKYYSPTDVNIVEDVGGVPAFFSHIGRTSKQFVVSKGQLNKFRIRPAVLTEHVESSRQVLGTVGASTIVGQIFQASDDNINGVFLTLESAGAHTELDNFESYADSAALVVEWVTVGGATNAVLETTVVSALSSSTKSMKLGVGNNVSEWVNTIASIDLTNVTLETDLYQTHADIRLSLYVGDGTNTKSIQVVPAAAGLWQHFDFSISALSEDGAGTTDESAITKLGWRVDVKVTAESVYVDNMEYLPPPGSVELKLWDMGTTLPISGTTALSDGAQYMSLGDQGITGVSTGSVILDLDAGKRLYHVNDFIAGVAAEHPSNIVLTASNYYALTVEQKSGEVLVYGPDTSFGVQYYESGYGFTVPSTTDALTGSGLYGDMMFGIFAATPAYITGGSFELDDKTGANVQFSVYIEDENMVITDTAMVHKHALTGSQNFSCDSSIRPHYMSKGSKFEVYYNDDPTDAVSRTLVSIEYLYAPPDTHG